MHIWMTLEKAASLYPEKTAIMDGKTVLTYERTYARVGALALFFREKGVHVGDRIAICEVNSYAFFEAYYAAAGLGAILCPINYRLSAKEMAFILNDSGARWIIAGSRFGSVIQKTLDETPNIKGIIWIGDSQDLQKRVESFRYDALVKTHESPFIPADIGDDQIAHLYYTSGTTGRSKGVILTHKNVCVHALAAIAELHLTDADIWGHVAPMFHLADAWATFAMTWVGGGHVMVGQFDPETVMAVIGEKRITLSNLIPTMLNLIVKHPKVNDYDFSSLRVVLSGGAPIAPELVRMVMEAFGCDYIQTYGMTETSPYLTMSLLKEHLQHLPEKEKLSYKAKTGRPFLAVELKVVDDELKPVAPDGLQVGEILVRGDTVTPGYWKRPEETEEAFVNGWLRTGDLAVLDSEGYVNIVDRKKDMILSGGENIFSTEVEYVLYMNPKILEAAVFGVPDEIWGEAVKAAVVLKPNVEATQEEIVKFCKIYLASYKAPKSIDFIEALPKTGSGKIYKRGLRDPYWRGKRRV